MKTHLAILIAFIATFGTCIASPANSKPSPTVPKAPEVSILNYTIDISNKKDRPPALPFLSVQVFGITENASKILMGLRDEMDLKLQKEGGVLTEEDYDMKVSPILKEYIPKFLALEPTTIIIHFPRKGESFLLTRKK